MGVEMAGVIVNEWWVGLESHNMRCQEHQTKCREFNSVRRYVRTLQERKK